MKVEKRYQNLTDNIDNILKDAEELQNARQFNSPKNAERIEAIKEKYKGDSKALDLIKDPKKIRRIKENLPKVKNIFEVKEELVKQMGEVKKELERREKLKGAKAQQEILEKEKSNLDAKWFDLDKKMSKAKDPNEKARLVEEQDKLKNEIIENENETSVKQKEFKENLENPNSKKFDSYKTSSDLARLNFELGRKVSMCNEACRGLLDGNDLGHIELDRTFKGKKFNSNEELARMLNLKKVKQNGKGSKESNEKNELTEVSEFETKHPRLAKFGKWFKNLFSRKNKDGKYDKDVDFDDKTEKESDVEAFRTRLKRVAEKGKDQVAKEDTQARLEAAKKAAIKRQNEKYGEDYSRRTGDER